jgi:NAD(P)H dehydrogenase (quinone)
MIVVTAASGRLGRIVATALANLGVAERVKLTSRDPSKLAEFEAQGFTTGRVDYGDQESMRAAFAGADTILLISMPGPVKERMSKHKNAFDEAKAAGIRRLVYTSRVNPTYESLYPFAPIHAYSEEYIRSIGLPATIVRNNEYVENVVKIVESNRDPSRLLLPGTRGKVPYIPVAEIAEILAKVTVEEGHLGKVYELNGPEALGRDDIAAIVGRATGRPAVASPISGDQFAEFMAELGRPAFIVEMVRGLHAAIDAGEFDTIYSDAECLLGRPVTPASEYLEKAFSGKTA